MTYFYIGLAVACGAMIQGAIGFAFGIFSIPLLVLIGLPLEQAITLVLGLVVVQTFASVWQNRAHIPWKDVATISAPRFLTVAVGIWMLAVVRDRWPPVQIKQMTGAVLIAIISVQIWIRPRPRASLHWGWAMLAGSVSGIMAGLIGMGGPVVVLWVMAHDWPNQRSRTLMWCTFALMVPWQLAVAYHRFGSPVLFSALLGLAYSPLVILATMLGTQLGNRMSQNRLRLAAYTVLVGVGVVSLIGPAFQ
jgi:uncharacterized membrane protein YfcA